MFCFLLVFVFCVVLFVDCFVSGEGFVEGLCVCWCFWIFLFVVVELFGVIFV